MSDKEGTLQMQASGRWAVCRPGREPVEVTSGELFRVEVDGALRITRMEHDPDDDPDGGYYSIDGYELRNGMRAAIGAERVRQDLNITLGLERDQAEVLLRFLRRVGKRQIVTVLDAARDEVQRFEQASKRLLVALRKALGNDE